MSGPKKIIAGVTSGSPPVYAGGASYGSGKPYFDGVSLYTDVSSSGNGSYTKSIATSGYNGRLDIYIVGTKTQEHDLYNNENQSTSDCSGTGENAKLTYDCQGDETGFVITQANWLSQNRTTSDTGIYAYCEFKIAGGVNANKAFKVGSGAGKNASFGIAGCASKVADDSPDTGFTFVGSGGRRNDGNLNYSDATTYPPGDYDDYATGDTTNTTTYANNSYARLAFNSTYGYCLEWKDLVASSSAQSRVLQQSFEVNGDRINSNSFGHVLIVYANNQ